MHVNLGCLNFCENITFASGHTAMNTPDPIRTRKLSIARPGQYWGGGPPGKPFGCRWLLYAIRGSYQSLLRTHRTSDAATHKSVNREYHGSAACARLAYS